MQQQAVTALQGVRQTHRNPSTMCSTEGKESYPTSATPTSRGIRDRGPSSPAQRRFRKRNNALTCSKDLPPPTTSTNIADCAKQFPKRCARISPTHRLAVGALDADISDGPGVPTPRLLSLVSKWAHLPVVIVGLRAWQHLRSGAKKASAVRSRKPPAPHNGQRGNLRAS